MEFLRRRALGGPCQENNFSVLACCAKALHSRTGVQHAHMWKLQNLWFMSSGPTWAKPLVSFTMLSAATHTAKKEIHNPSHSPQQADTEGASEI